MSDQAPNFLGDDGSASIATGVMLSHHGFRRDLAHFARSLRRLEKAHTAAAAKHLAVHGPSDEGLLAALRDEWQHYRNTLHGHHEAEDHRLFPSLQGQHAELVSVIERLTADHRQIDPLIERGDRAFAALTSAAVEPAAKVVAELSTLLHPHLALEEARLIPFMRDWKEFPAPNDEAELGLICAGFAWGCHGVASDVLERVFAMLPPVLTSKLPAARAAFEARYTRVWGDEKPGAARTPIPDWLTSQLSA